MAVAALSGDTTLTASKSTFKSTDVGRLYRLASVGQSVTASVTAQANGTSSVLVTGLGALDEFLVRKNKPRQKSRKIAISLTGTWTATVTLQRSLDDTTWTDVKQYTTNTSEEYEDNLDNQEVYYRLYVDTGDFTSGTVGMAIDYPGGSIEGICKVTEYTSTTVVNVQVLTEFGSTDATLDWYAGQWGGDEGYPSALTIFEGRLWFAGPDVWGSESDQYASFDRDIEGDSASIFRSVGFGPVPKPYWLIDSSRLMMGILSDEISIRSDSFGAILTPTNVNIKPGSNQGAANVAPLRIDDYVYFVQRSGTKVYQLSYDMSNDRAIPQDLMRLNETICSAGIKRIVSTRQPETRIFALLDNGEIRVFTFDVAEDVQAWSRIDTYGTDTFEDIFVLPSTGEDRVYVVANRSNGRYLEKLALTSEAEGGSTSKHFDSFLSATSPGTSITGLSHLEGETVYVWADGQQRGETYTVSAGQVTVSDSWTNVVVGLRYNGDWVSSKLQGNPRVQNLTVKQRVTHIGIIARNLWRDGLTYGPSFDNMDSLPLIEDGTSADTENTETEYDTVPFEFDGSYNTDSRIYLRATAPATIMALVYEVKPDASSTEQQILSSIINANTT
jgi:hypothetical protein